MKRDWNLLRWVLNEAELCGGSYPIVLTRGIYNGSHYSLDIGELDFSEVCEHMLLLNDAGLATVRELGRDFKGSIGVALDRLTMEGHDFLKAARDESRWQQAMKIVNEKGGTVTFGVLIQVLSALAKRKFGL